MEDKAKNFKTFLAKTQNILILPQSITLFLTSLCSILFLEAPFTDSGRSCNYIDLLL
jgi:hypothetical protein